MSVLHPRHALVALLAVACGGSSTGGADDGDDDTTQAGPTGADSDAASTSAADTSSASASAADTSAGTTTPGDTMLADSSGGESTDTGEQPEPAIHVRGIDGLDSNPGTPDAPVRTIQHGLELAVETAVPNVLVAAGDYTASTPDEDAIDVPGGISLVGGFAADDWTVHDPIAHTTRISGIGDFVVRITGGERDDTLLEGFTIDGPGVDTLVLVDGSPTIRRNVVTQTQAIVGGLGIDVVGGAPRISRNRVLVLDGNDITFIGATAIRILGDGALVDANMVYAQGEGTFADTAGVAIAVGMDASVQLYGNSLRAAGVPGLAVTGDLTGTEIVGNNLIVPTTELFTGCVDAFNYPPAVLTHNNFDCAAFYTIPGYQPLDTLAELHAQVDGASDNVDVSLQYADPQAADLHLIGADALPCDVAVGGSDLGAEVGADYDGAARTVPWTIGAEEHDTPCV